MSENKAKQESRRDFLHYATFSFGAMMMGSSAWALGASMAPSAAARHIDHQLIDLRTIAPGQTQLVKVGGEPIHIRHLTPEQIDEILSMDSASLWDDHARNENLSDRCRAVPENRMFSTDIGTFVIVMAHDPIHRYFALPDAGDFDGWFTPVLAGHYDLLGRIHKGPSGRNLIIPKFNLTDKHYIEFLGRNVMSKQRIYDALYGQDRKGQCSRLADV